jgi:glycosyltransferase involved in cell wall biosynthesis
MKEIIESNCKEDNNHVITISTITPVYRGEKYLPKLVERIAEFSEKLKKNDAPILLIESIFVDDGSVDNSATILEELSATYDWVRVITLSRNFGQHSATVAGICHSQGDWIVTLDEDLQHDPRHIDEMLEIAVQNSADLVYAKPQRKVHGGIWRDRASNWTKRILGRLSEVKEITVFNSYRLIRGNIARAAASVCSNKTFLDVALTWFTRSIISMKVSMRDERHATEGASGYSFLTLINHARKLMVNSNVDFARWGIIIGFISIVFAIFLASWAFIGKLFFPETIHAPGWASIMATIALLGGVIIAIVCVILEYVSIMLMGQLGKPVFFTVDRTSDKFLLEWFSNVSSNNSVE